MARESGRRPIRPQSTGNPNRAHARPGESAMSAYVVAIGMLAVCAAVALTFITVLNGLDK